MSTVYIISQQLGGEPEQTIVDYVEREILLPSDSVSLIPHSCQIKHACGIYEKLSMHRSVRFIANGDDPFSHEEISKYPSA